MTAEQLTPNRGQRGETSKARARRLRDGWFDIIDFTQPGLDIGSGEDALCFTFARWERHDGDAQYLPGVPDELYQTVYASHVLEHMVDPIVALRNWWRVLKPGGVLIVIVPHMDLYEKKRELPSVWNPDHKTFWNEKRLELALYMAVEPVVVPVLRDEGYHDPGPGLHPLGEYSVEAVVRK